jgi:outer membrane protein OmpA-like peptidoglycan-associated protein
VTVGTPYAHSFTASGFPVPTFSTLDPLPPGLTLTAAGLLAGTASAGAVGTYPFTVTAANGIGTVATRTISLIVNPVLSAPVLTASTPTTATIGTAYSYPFAASGFPAPTFATVGPLPVGLSLTTAGVLTGTPSSGTAGSYSFTLSATNGSGTVSAGVSVTVVPAAAAATFPVAPTMPTAVIGTAYAYTFAGAGYPAPSYSIASGTLPVGLTLDLSTGVISGTPTTATVASFTIAATNSSGTVQAGPITLTVNPPPAAPVFTAAQPPGATAGTVYSYSFAATGFPLPTFTTTDALPVGLTLSSAGVLAGTPAGGSVGSYPITMTATNGIGSGTASFTLSVVGAPAAPVLGATTPPSTGVIESAYSTYVFTASGVPAPTFAVTGGSLPSGLTLNPTTGALAGTPTAAGIATFRIQAQNSLGTVTTAELAITVTPAPAAPAFSAATPSSTGTVGTAYAYTFSTTGYPVPTFAVASGALPAGLTLNPVSGTLSGTPSATGTSMFTVSATNSAATTNTGLITMTIAAAPASGGSGGGSGGGSTPTTPTTPVAPASVSVTAGTASLAVTWPAVAGATGYTASASPGSSTCSTTSDTACVLGAVAGTTYTVTVVARSAGGESAASTASNPVTPTAPPVPAAVPPEAPTTLTTDKGQIAEAERGSSITVIGTGFAAFSTVTVVIYSTPTVLGNAVTDSAGAFSLPVTIPTGLEIGKHTFLATGVDQTGAARLIDLPITVPSVTTGGGGGNDTPVGRARLTFGTRVVSSVGSHAAVIAPCALDVGVIRICTVTATVPVTVRGVVRRVVVGKGVTRLTATQKLGAVKVSVPLTKQGRTLAARPGGVRIRFVAVVNQRGVTETASVTRTTTVLAKRFTLSPTVHYTGSSSTLRASERSYLKSVRLRLAGATVITCIGHADSRGTAGSTRALAARRGRAACAVIAKDLKVKVRAAGQAEKKPKGRKNTPAARAHNRRVTITITS